MKLYKKSSKRKLSEVSMQLKNATGQKRLSDKLPQGHDAIVNFDFGDIYIDDCLFNILNDDMVSEIDACLSDLMRGKYGICSEDEIEDNEESRWFGNGTIVAKYKVSFGVIQISKMRDKTEIKRG